MLRGPTSPPAHVSPAQSQPSKRRSGIGGATGEDAHAIGIGIPVQSAPITRGSRRVQLRLLPRSFAAARALGGLGLHLVWCLCLSMHGVLRTKPPFARTESLVVDVRQAKLHASGGLDLERSAE
jgi:hypothetical protein